MANSISLKEFEPVGRVNPGASSLGKVRASRVELRAVAQNIGDATAPISPFEQDEAGNWRASRWIGKVVVGNTLFEIKPRIGDEIFKRIAVDAITIALVPNSQSHVSAPNIRDIDLLPLIWCLAFQRAFSRQTMPRLYVTKRSASRVDVRGRLDLERQLTENHLAQHHLACIWNELSFDNPLTQTILATIDHLARQRRYPFHSASSLHSSTINRVRSDLMAQGVRPSTDAVDQLVSWSRANDTYRAQHELARGLLRNRGSTSATGFSEALLLDSAEIWELFLFRRLITVVNERNLPLRIHWPRNQPERRWLMEWEGRSTRLLIPDIIVTETTENPRVAILDAKYRHFSPPSSDPSIADQMALYAMTSSGTDRQDAPPPTMMLVYPAAEGLNPGASGILGKGRFHFANHQCPLIAWAVPLLKIDGKTNNLQNFYAEVDTSLKQLLDVAFPAQ